MDLVEALRGEACQHFGRPKVNETGRKDEGGEVKSKGCSVREHGEVAGSCPFNLNNGLWTRGSVEFARHFVRAFKKWITC
ncbi:hypothetical protein SESBI_38652 [Sesbania bispinosa]|nr:hypothetical protein SESBI_38652 [Sesbania bispinosa]